jgi:hypothetical protein
LVGSVTISTFTFSSGGRIACGSGLFSVIVADRNCPTRSRRIGGLQRVIVEAGMRFM